MALPALLILDRDGVINEDSDNYIRSVDQWVPIPGSLEAMARLHRAGVPLAVATNQSGIARGYYDLAELEAMHDKLRRLLAALGGEVAAIEYCPHGPDDGCDCRKPLPGMIERLLARFGVAPERALVVGDSVRDLEAAAAAGVPAVLVRTGKGERSLASGRVPVGVPVYDDLAALADALLEEEA